MALTKVRLPVADISAISNGTSDVDIATGGGNVVVTAGGATAATFGSSTVTLSQPTTVTNLDGVENVDLTVGAGATGVLEAIAASIRLWTTSAHTLVLGANSLTGLTIGTDGKVTLAVEGTAAGHLVTKNYVDTAAGLGSSDITANTATNGSISIPNSTGNDLILNWGVTPSISNTQTAVTFDTAFPNAVFVGYATRQNAGASLESAAHVKDLTTTGMNVVNSGGTSSPVGWLAIGY